MTELPALPSPPAPVSSTVTRVMKSNRSRDTKPEIALRKALHRRGLRFFKNRRVPGLGMVADVLMPRRQIAIFVDGCFWHGCPEHYRKASRNSAFWEAKVARNRARDARDDAALQAAGWTVVRVWEHEDPERVADTVLALLDQPC